MFETKRSGGRVRYEDLLREFSAIEQNLIKENSNIAMDLMVLEAKVRERFDKLEARAMDRPFFTENDQLSLNDIHALIPYEIPETAPIMKRWRPQQANRALGTMGAAAVLAVVTALGVFGLASLLQLALGWLG